MMRALVVYESMFGNTELIADAIAGGLSERIRVDAVEVGVAPATVDEDVALLVVGGPTHAFGMSRPQTRQDAARQATAGLVSGGMGLREWLATLQGRAGIAAATFDTRISRPRLPGSAARAAEKRLRRLGFRVIAPAQSFYVEGTLGPLLGGEKERARRWGETLGSKTGDLGHARR
jgi:flavorubredoxin